MGWISNTRGRARALGVLSEVEISEYHARHLVEDDGAVEAESEDRKEYRLIADAVWLL